MESLNHIFRRPDLRFERSEERDPEKDITTLSRRSQLKRWQIHGLVVRILGVRWRKRVRRGQFFERLQYLLAGRILLHTGFRSAAVFLLEKVFKWSLRHDDRISALLCAQLLRHHYGVMEGDRKRYRFYQQHAGELLRLYVAEAKADACYEELLFSYQNLKIGRSEIASLAESYSEQIKNEPDFHQSVKLIHRYHFCRVIFRMSQNDYAQTADCCILAIRLLQEQAFCPPPYIRSYLFQLALCQIQMLQFNAARQTLDQLEGYLHPGNSNWFKRLELTCILELRALHFEAAGIVLHQVFGHTAFSKMPAMDKENWFILEAYLFFLAPGAFPERRRKFRLGKFLNQTSRSARDKQGANVSLLILQLLFLIRQERYDEFIDRTESIEKYTFRYLRAPAFRRSRFFLQLLIQTCKGGFRKARVQPRIRSWHKKLLDTPPQLASEPHEIEVVPYEELWQIIWSKLP